MEITKKQNRFEINGIEDSFQQDGKTLAGISGYGEGLVSRIVGWVLSFFDVTVYIEDDKHFSCYLDRIDAIDWLKRHGENVDARLPGSQVVKRIRAVADRKLPPLPTTSTSFTPAPSPQPTGKEPDLLKALAILEAAKKEEYDNAASAFIKAGFLQMRGLSQTAQNSLSEQLSTDNFTRYIYDHREDKNLIKSFLELVFSIQLTPNQLVTILSRLQTILPINILDDDQLKKIETSFLQIDSQNAVGISGLSQEIFLRSRSKVFISYLAMFIQINHDAFTFSARMEFLDRLSKLFHDFSSEHVHTRFPHQFADGGYGIKPTFEDVMCLYETHRALRIEDETEKRAQVRKALGYFIHEPNWVMKSLVANAPEQQRFLLQAFEDKQILYAALLQEIIASDDEKRIEELFTTIPPKNLPSALYDITPVVTSNERFLKVMNHLPTHFRHPIYLSRFLETLGPNIERFTPMSITTFASLEAAIDYLQELQRLPWWESEAAEKAKADLNRWFIEKNDLPTASKSLPTEKKDALISNLLSDQFLSHVPVSSKSLNAITTFFFECSPSQEQMSAFLERCKYFSSKVIFEQSPKERLELLKRCLPNSKDMAIKALYDFVKEKNPSYDELKPTLDILNELYPELTNQWSPNIGEELALPLVRYNCLQILNSADGDLHKIRSHLYKFSRESQEQFGVWLGQQPLPARRQLQLFETMKTEDVLRVPFLKGLLRTQDISRIQPIFASFLPKEREFGLDSPGALMQLLPEINTPELLKMAIRSIPTKRVSEQSREIYLKAFAKGITNSSKTMTVGLTPDVVEKVYQELDLEEVYNDAYPVSEERLPTRHPYPDSFGNL